MFSDMENNKPSTPHSNYTLEPIIHQYDINRKPSLFMNNGGKESLDIKDVMVLNDIIDQVKFISISQVSSNNFQLPGLGAAAKQSHPPQQRFPGKICFVDLSILP